MVTKHLTKIHPYFDLMLQYVRSIPVKMKTILILPWCSIFLFYSKIYRNIYQGNKKHFDIFIPGIFRKLSILL